MKLEELLERLQEFDLLLDADRKLPSVTGFVAGDNVRGSWWTHPQSHEMYSLACQLSKSSGCADAEIGFG